jgi:CheY-like chemotaxis protein
MARPRPDDAPPSAVRVLLVDDNVDNLDLYNLYLTHEGFETYEARDGHEAIARARALKPAVIIMDLTMPGLDGWEATRQIKADPDLRGIWVIVLTGHALDTDSEIAARAAGCDEYLRKPLLPEDLAAKIRRVLGSRRRPKRS